MYRKNRLTIHAIELQILDVPLSLTTLKFQKPREESVIKKAKSRNHTSEGVETKPLRRDK